MSQEACCVVIQQKDTWETATLLKARFESHAVNALCMTAATDIQHDKVSLSCDSGYRCYSGPGKQKILISIWAQMGYI